MGLETGTTIGDLNVNWPLGTDPVSLGDDHIRLIKTVLVDDVVGIAEGGRFLKTIEVGPFDFTASDVGGCQLTASGSLKAQVPLAESDSVPLIQCFRGSTEFYRLQTNGNLIAIGDHSLTGKYTNFGSFNTTIENGVVMVDSGNFDIGQEEGKGGRINAASTAGGIQLQAQLSAGNNVPVFRVYSGTNETYRLTSGGTASLLNSQILTKDLLAPLIAILAAALAIPEATLNDALPDLP